MQSQVYKNQNGGLLMLVLVFTTLFVVVAGGLVTLALSQNKLGQKQLAQEQALKIAEAGLNYYRWHLAHDPNDFQDGTGGPGPYVHDYNDPYGSKIGEFSLEITEPSGCTSDVTITSTGVTVDEPNISRTVRAIYGTQSLANFAFLTNSNVWFGDTENLNGPVHSNGGIRMDGTHNAQVTSAKETYICTSEQGCSDEVKDGIWGSGGTPGLWEYPVPVIDFDSITADLATLKTQAQDFGIYISQQGLGYHINFLADGTFDLYRVTGLENPVWGYDGSGWVRDSWDIKKETFVQNYAIPSTCGIIFIEDNVWVDGVVNGEVTLIAAKLPEVKNNMRNIIINGDISYLDSNGGDILGIIAQNDILIPLYSAPDNLEIDAALLAQNGHVFRYYYQDSYSPYYLRDTVELTGVIISNTTWTFNWVNAGNNIISGYQNTITNYDPNLLLNPPPGFPTEGAYGFIKWEEVN